MATPPFLVIRGTVVLLGKRPDGDSVRFRPAAPGRLARLAGFDRERTLSEDGTAQLRLEGIDAPERAYAGEAQPRALPARDALLRALGFTRVRTNAEGEVTAATPRTRPATIVARAHDPNGRPIAYLLGADDDPPEDGTTLPAVPAALLRRSRNAALLEAGLAYLTVYRSTPAANRRTLRAIAARARARDAGVWAADRTASFPLRRQADIGPQGALVLPKLFRRATDYLRDRAEGFRGTLPQWLRTAGPEPGAEDDEVLLGRRRTRLSALVRQRGDRIIVTADLLDLVFVEEPA